MEKKGRVALADTLNQNRLGLGRQRREPETQGAGLEGGGTGGAGSGGTAPLVRGRFQPLTRAGLPLRLTSEGRGRALWGGSCDALWARREPRSRT